MGQGERGHTYQLRVACLVGLDNGLHHGLPQGEGGGIELHPNLSMVRVRLVRDEVREAEGGAGAAVLKLEIHCEDPVVREKELAARAGRNRRRPERRTGRKEPRLA